MPSKYQSNDKPSGLSSGRRATKYIGFPFYGEHCGSSGTSEYYSHVQGRWISNAEINVETRGRSGDKPQQTSQSGHVWWRAIKLDADHAQRNGRLSLHRDQRRATHSQQEDHRGCRIFADDLRAESAGRCANRHERNDRLSHGSLSACHELLVSRRGDDSLQWEIHH